MIASFSVEEEFNQQMRLQAFVKHGILGAADYPFLNEYSFIGWIRANPRESGGQRIAMLVLDKMDEGPDSRGEGAALKPIPASRRRDGCA